MKILLVNKFHYARGGSETYYFALADILERMGHEVVYFSMRDERNLPCGQSEFFAPNRDYTGDTGALGKLRSAASLIYSGENKRLMEALLDREKPDIAHLNLVHRQLTFSIVDALAARHIPMVYTAHDLTCVCPAISMVSPTGLCQKCLGGHFGACVRQRCVKGSLLKSLLGAEEARFLHRKGLYDKIGLYIAPSDFLRDKLIEGAFTRSPIVSMPNFLSEGAADSANPSRDGGLVYAGRLVPEKGVGTLIKAMALMPDERLDVLGDGAEREALEALSEGLRLTDRVRFLGQQSREAVRHALAGAKAVVVPSECYDISPYALLEALAQGTPVVGSDIGGIPELARGHGELFAMGDAQSLADAVARLNALDSVAYSTLCQGALDLARERFDPDRYGQALVRHYQSLLENR